MVNRGDGGARRPAPPARPAPKARPADDEDNEKTNAINLADMNLDDIDEAPVPVAAPARGAAPKPAAKLGSKSFDDEDNEKTNAFNLADVNLDDIDEPAPAPRAAVSGTRPQPGRAPVQTATPRATAPAPAARPQPGRPAPSADDVERAMREPAAAPAKKAPAPAAYDDGNEKTSALNLNDIDLDAIDAAPPKKAAPPPRTAQVAAPAKVAPPAAKPAPVAPPPKKEAAPVIEKTMAVSLEEFEVKRSAASKLKSEPAAADRTYLVDDEEPPVVKAPPGKKVGAAAKQADEPAGAVDTEPRLVVRGGPDVGKGFQLTKDLTLVGRGLDADVVINDASASRKHFNIVRTLSGWKLVDLGSGNGTKVDGQRVTEIALKNGMRIESGGTTMEWVHDGTGPKSAAASAKAPAAQEPQGRGVTGAAAQMPEEAKPSRRVQEDKPQERKRDASRLDKFDDKDEQPKSKAKQAPVNEEKTSFGDIQALEIDPEWEARRAKQRREGVAEVEPAEVESDGDEVEVKKGGVGKKIAIVGVLVAVLGGGFVAADKFAGLGIIFPKGETITKPDPKPEEDKKPDEKTADDKKPDDKPVDDKKPDDKPVDDKKPDDKPIEANAGGDAAKAKEEAKTKVGEAATAAKDKRFIASRDLYAAALKLDALVDGGDSGLIAVENELKAYAALNNGVKLIGEQKWTDALKAAKEVKEASAYHAQAQELVKLATEGAVVEQLRKASDLLGKKDVAGAKAAITEALKDAGDYAVGTALKEAIERAGAPDADLQELDPSDPNAKNPPKAAPSDLKPGFDAYAKGDFQAVANAFDSIVYGGTASRIDVAKAKAFSSAATWYDESMKQVAATVGKPEEQLGHLNTARRADAVMGGANATKLATEFAKVWAALAKKAWDAKDAVNAGFSAKIALGFDPASAEAKTVQTEAIKAAKAWVTEAKGIKDAPDKVADLYARALRVLPKDDPDFAPTDTALAAMLKPTE